ncbi:hypothetical protein ABFT23_04130 [Nocardioides sp. C4-1]|uniref:hypothetical protein n=1 Tax=Nocardioides sp. C4-1 TaxID=3151851 RepID=UPI003262EF8F
MTAKTPPRPPQVTMLGSFVLGASAMLVLLAFDRVAALTTIEAQQDIADFLGTSSGEVLGLDADGMQTLIKAIWTFLGGAAVITSFLGWRVLQRDRGARLALSILVPLMLLSGSVVWQVNATFSFDEMLTILVAVSTLLLWTQPARDWFAGRTPAPLAPRPTSTAATAAPAAPTSTPTALPGYAPPPTAGQSAGASTPPPAPDPWGRTPTAAPEPGKQPLPRPVVTAVVATIVASSVVLAACLIGLVGVTTDRSGMENAMADEISGRSAYDDLDLDPALLVNLTIGLLVVLLVWAIIAIGLAAMVANRVNAARIALAVSAIGAALASLLGAMLVVPLLITAACITVAVVLLRSSTSQWFAEQKRPGQHR